MRLLPDKFCAFINFRDKSAPGPAMKHLQGKEVGGEHLLIRYPNNPVPEQIVLKKPIPTGWDKVDIQIRVYMDGHDMCSWQWVSL